MHGQRKSSKKCLKGYVKNKSSRRCVYATGKRGRSLSKKRASKVKLHKRSGRPSPNVSATLFPVDHVRLGNDRKMWRVKKGINGVKRWVKF